MMRQLPRQTYRTKRGYTYSFIHIPPQPTSQQTLLFLHGFPSQIHDWTHQIAHFFRQGYGIIAPDLLGYGESSKPSDASDYRLRLMCDDVTELVGSLRIQGSLVGVGHDFGATLLSRMVAYYPDYFSALVFIAVGPPKMGTPFDVAVINEMTKKMLGYELLGYISWMGGEADDAHEELERHAESAMSLLFCADHKIWDEWFRPLGKMKQFVSEDRRVEVGPWYTPDFQRHHLEAFGQKDGYKGAVCWYRMWMGNLFKEDEVGYEEFQAKQPVLLISDKTPGGEQQKGMLASWAPNLKVATMDGGHWLHLEQPDETNRLIEEFLQC